jgi:glyoxylase-like metal-dependent hydrolase (beta-lactamase superfamily II)
MSHWHGDHAGNANDYAGSTWIVQRAEQEAMFQVPAA